MTSGRAAIASALSTCSSGVTQTGQPGPWIIRTPTGNASSIPCLTIVCVCPPQTSIRVHGRVVTRWISATSFLARTGSRYSSRYFTRGPRAGSGAGPLATGPPNAPSTGVPSSETTAGSSIPGPIVASSWRTMSPIVARISSVLSASSSSTRLIANPTWMIT